MQQVDQNILDLTINGERRTLAGRPTVAELLASLGLDIRKVAVERNAIEIVHFIGGG